MSNKRYNWNDIQQMYNAGNSFNDLQDLLGISQSALIKASKRGDLITRSNGEGVRLAKSKRNTVLPTTKKCPTCDRFFSIIEFTPTRKYCKECWNIRNRKYNKTPNGILAKRKGTRIRRARFLGAKNHHTEKEWLKLLESYNNQCAFCHTKNNITKDHIIPLTKGGDDNIENIQPLCRSCNSKKSNKIIEN